MQRSMSFYYVAVKAFKASLLILAAASCCRQPTEVWDDTKSCGRHFGRGIKALAGFQTTSRQVQCKDEFVCWDQPLTYEDNSRDSEFIAMPEERDSNQIAMADYTIPQPKVSPGDFNSPVPGIDSFRDPSQIANLKGTFRNVYFDYNSDTIKNPRNLETLQAVAAYLQTHPNTYLFLEGNTDERGAAAYNLALGTRRSNAVRNALVQSGANPERLFTISYGAERPVAMGSNEEAWAANRRVEFKIYQRS